MKLSEALGFLLICVASFSTGVSLSHLSLQRDAQKPQEPTVWNRVNVPDMTAAIASTAGKGGTIKLHLQGAKARDGIDNIAVALNWTAVGDNGPAPVWMALANWPLKSEAFDGDMIWDATQQLNALFQVDQIGPINVIYNIVPRNRGVHLDDSSFVVDWTYFEVFNADGKPVLQERKPKPSNAVAGVP